MPKFKVGDKVERLADCFARMKPGDIGTVVGLCDDGSIKLKEFGARNDKWHDNTVFKLVKKPANPTKHKYVISSTGFKSRKAALDKIKKWKDAGTLKQEETFVYQVDRMFKPVDLLKLEEVK